MIKINGNTPSSKNSKQWTGKYLVNSKTVQNFKKEAQYDFVSQAMQFRNIVRDLPKPYKVHFYFIRDSKRRFDYVNVVQIVLDEMVAYRWIEDDNADEIIPVFDGYEVDKENAGVIISV
jgi:hypothetical protein